MLQKVTELKRSYQVQQRSVNLNSASFSAHVVNRLWRENRKSIPTFFSGKELFEKCNPPDFKFYLDWK